MTIQPQPGVLAYAGRPLLGGCWLPRDTSLTQVKGSSRDPMAAGEMRHEVFAVKHPDEGSDQPALPVIPQIRRFMGWDCRHRKSTDVISRKKTGM